MKNKIVFIHLLNDYSGSPKVLSQVIDIHLESGFNCHLLVGSGGEGFLSRFGNITSEFMYRRGSSRILTLIYYLFSQMSVFLKVLRLANKDTVVYVNTMLPFGAGLAAKLRKAPVIYHIHETSIKPNLLKAFLKKVIFLCSKKNIYVSKYLMENEPIGKNNAVVYNSVEALYAQKGSPNMLELVGKFNVIMACSLKEYKGVNEFMEIARLCLKNLNIQFHLILNATDFEIDSYSFSPEVPTNVNLYSKQMDLTSFYSRAHLVINLSHTDKWIETFGLTLVEAMAFGIPVIAPPVGGPTEIVEDGTNGYLLRSTEVEAIAQKISTLSQEPRLMSYLSKNAKNTVERFSIDRFSDGILGITKEVIC